MKMTQNLVLPNTLKACPIMHTKGKHLLKSGQETAVPSHSHEY
jgi:hypothetical protein